MLRPHTSQGGKRRNTKDKAADTGAMAQRQRLKSSSIKRKGEVAVLRNTDESRARVASALDRNTHYLSVPETAVSSRARTKSAEFIEPLTENSSMEMLKALGINNIDAWRETKDASNPRSREQNSNQRIYNSAKSRAS